MERESKNIIDAMTNGNIFSVPTVDSQIRSEVSFFRNLLIGNINNHEVFHGYINKINAAWDVILTGYFKKLILMYNTAYVNYTNKKREHEQEMIRMADEINAKQLFEDIEELNVSPNIFSISRGMGKSSISKRPRKKSSKK